MNSVADWLLNIAMPFIYLHIIWPDSRLRDVVVPLIALICYTGLVFACEDESEYRDSTFGLQQSSLSAAAKREFLGEHRYFTIEGAGPHKVTLRMHPGQTFEDIVRELRKRRLVPELQGLRLQYSFVFPGGKRPTIELSDTLEDVGVQNLSVVSLRYHVLGGSKRSAPAHDVNESSTASSSAEPSSKAKLRPDVWYANQDGSYRCRVCHTEPTFKRKQRIDQHEKTDLHRTSLARHDAAIAAAAVLGNPGAVAAELSEDSAPKASPELEPGDVAGSSGRTTTVANRLSAAISDALSGVHRQPNPPAYCPEPPPDLSSTGTFHVDWNAPEIQAANLAHDPHLDPQHPLRVVEQQLHDYIQNGPDLLDVGSDESECEADGWDDDSDWEQDDLMNTPATYTAQDSRSDAAPGENPWYPWPDKQTCILDVLRHIPRCSFSRKQNSAIHWALQAMGVDNLPSDRSMDDIDSLLQRMCGIQTIRHEGKLGHIFYVNDLAGIIGQEMANPIVREKLHFYPEEAKSRLAEAWQANRWLNELDPSLATPMVREKEQDFYVHEPMLMRDHSVYMPIRWFVKDDAMHARAWQMRAVQSNGRSGWLVLDDQPCVVRLQDALLSLPHFARSYQYHDLPDPTNIIGFADMSGHITASWSLTDPKQGNSWRVKSKGQRVVAFPMWLYCDDTSGNVSKKWNKHNSFLFTAAGLPREDVHQESNIHFLCTSNTAPPLEMLDGIVDHLEEAQQNGIWAWDAALHERVLVIPSVLAFLGDNPMQSEIACHIGFRGRLFCRICKVSGIPDGDDDDAEENGLDPAGYDSDASDGSQIRGKGKKKRANETMEDMIRRLESFMKVCEPRTRAQTEKELASQYAQACAVGGKTAYKQMKTESGVKDTFLEGLLEYRGVFAATVRKGRSKQRKQEDVANIIKSLPQPCTSPIWRVADLDPHRDTPVEILHTILLGFVKYFWRDALTRVKKPDRDTLIHRLSSVDVSGLGVPPLAGHTLVTYGRSLTGRDFRVLAQRYSHSRMAS